MAFESTRTWRSIRVDDAVAQFCRKAVESLKQLVPDDYSTTNSGTNRDKQDVVMTFPCTIPVFRQTCEVCIIIQKGIYAKVIGYLLGQSEIMPLGVIRRSE